MLLGATAVGKTAAVAALASHFDHVIYADASLCYHQLNIGVAKPTLADQALLPHHMINILDMDEQLSVVDFVAQADTIIHELPSRQHALLTGGSLYYMKHFLYGMPKTPVVEATTRQRVQAELEQIGHAELHAKLATIDPISAERIAINDSYRITRAIEVFYDSGRPLSSYALPNKLREEYDFLLIELVREREELYHRINLRVDAMWQAGLVDEVKRLRQLGLHKDMPAARAIGYREFFDESLSLLEIKELIKKNSRHYAKRQLTFLRSLPIDYPIPADDIGQLKSVVTEFLSSY